MYDQFITVSAELSVSSELKFSDGQFSYWQKIFSAFKHNKSRQNFAHITLDPAYCGLAA